jgi:hypothetical protein
LRLAAALLPVLLAACADATGKAVLVVIEDRLSRQLLPELTQFRKDLQAEGYSVTVDSSLDAESEPLQLRSLLQRTHRSEAGLTGAILVGNFKAPLHNRVENMHDPYWHDQLVDLYYMDLDGVWQDLDGDGVLEVHTERNTSSGFVRKLRSVFASIVTGDRRHPEIWVSRLRAGPLQSLGDEIELLRAYFQRNHRYRTDSLALPQRRAFVAAAGMKVLESTWGARPALLFDSVAVSQCNAGVSASLRTFLTAPEGFQLGIVSVFSGPRIHHFDLTEGNSLRDFWFQTPEGRWRIADFSDEVHPPSDVTSAEIAATRPNVLFYHILSSETGRHDRPEYLGGAYLFFGSGLAVVAGTQHSGAIGVPLFYEELAAGASLGEAWRHAIAWSLSNAANQYPQVWCDRTESWSPGDDPYRAVLLGDGTLKMPPGPASRDASTRP